MSWALAMKKGQDVEKQRVLGFTFYHGTVYWGFRRSLNHLKRQTSNKLSSVSPLSTHPAMEEENEVLDWGNEDDEQQHQGAYRENDARRDLDDAEDSVSLGEDEDEQEYYAQPQQYSNGPAISRGSGSDSTSQSANHYGIQKDQPPKSSQEVSREDLTASLTTQNQSFPDSPHMKDSSTEEQSRQRSHSFSTTRITHALPPKPLAATIPFLHPSHPSIVEATAMFTRPAGRSESNKGRDHASSTMTVSTSSAGGDKSSAPGTADLDTLPPGWEVRHSRGGAGVYFYNVQTSQSTWTRPLSDSESSHPHIESHGDSTLQHRSSIVDAVEQPLSRYKSDLPQEHSRPRRTQPPLDPATSDFPPASSSSLGTLSYEDRHYRPGGVDNNGSSATDNRRSDRNRDEPLDSRFNPHPDVAFTPSSPPRPRGHERSLSPPLPSSAPRGRDSRPPLSMRHGRGANTDADSSMHRDRDTPQTIMPRNHWNQASPNGPVEMNNSNYQGSRRQQRQQNVDSYEPSATFEDRSPLARNGSSRGRNRDRDQSRATEVREQNQNISAPSTLSASSHTPYLHLWYACTATVASALLHRSAILLLAWLQIESLANVAPCVVAPVVPCSFVLDISSPLLDSRTLAHYGLYLFLFLSYAFQICMYHVPFLFLFSFPLKPFRIQITSSPSTGRWPSI